MLKLEKPNDDMDQPIIKIECNLSHNGRTQKIHKPDSSCLKSTVGKFLNSWQQKPGSKQEIITHQGTYFRIVSQIIAGTHSD